jgi:hypothetical protein
MTFKDLLSRFKPANKNYNYLQIKELSEIMEAAKAGATHHVLLYFKAAKQYEAACRKYAEQCQKPRIYKGFDNGQI